MVRYKAPRECKLVYGDPPIGHYALEPEPEKALQWDHCREQFAPKFLETTYGFFFSHLTDKGNEIAAFLTKFERIVGVAHSSFALTNRKTVLWIEPSSFWLCCPMRRSLLTILLRCALNYEAQRDNFDNALFGEYKESEYMRQTRSATLRFMFGFTRWTAKMPITMSSSVIKHGWKEEFHSLDDAMVRRRLVLPEGETRENTIVGAESLWA
jgi:hypothetical protein